MKLMLSRLERQKNVSQEREKNENDCQHEAFVGQVRILRYTEVIQVARTIRSNGGKLYTQSEEVFLEHMENSI